MQEAVGVESPRAAIPFISYDDATKSYVVNEEAVAFLDTLQNKIGETTGTTMNIPLNYYFLNLCYNRQSAHEYCLPAGVIIVAGRYRSGKSFLMNQMTQARTLEGEGFGMGHTIESYTKGIWMLPRAIKGKTESGEDVDMIVMDSEGLGAAEQVIMSFACRSRVDVVLRFKAIMCQYLV